MLKGKKTYIGLLIVAAPMVAGFFGINIGPEAASELGGMLAVVVDNLEEIIVSAGLLIGAYGRLVTKG